MFKIVINKTKFDSSFNFENEVSIFHVLIDWFQMIIYVWNVCVKQGEEEAMFLEYRKSIKLLFDSITQLDNDFALSTIKTYVLDVANNWQMKPFAEIENALYLFYLLGEAIPVIIKHIQKLLQFKKLRILNSVWSALREIIFKRAVTKPSVWARWCAQ